jgi:hypothetical protein
MAIRLNTNTTTYMANIFGNLFSGTGGTAGTAGILKVYDGTQPGTGGSTSGASNMIIQFSSLSWAVGTNGSCLLSSAVLGTAGMDGTATWARLSNADGSTYIIDGNCGTASTCEFVIDAAEIVQDQVITLSAATFIQPAS